MSAQAALAIPPKPGKRRLRMLVTGFGPFRNVETNPSWLAVSGLNNQTLKFPVEPVPAHPHAPKPQPEFVEAHVSAVEVPVTYTAVLSMIPPLHASKQYDVILHVGVGSPGGLEVERLAHKMGYNQTDADGKLCEGTKGKRGFGQGYEEFGDQIRTGVDVDAIVEHLHSKGLKNTKPSNDPGRYLCDFIYYCSLACAQRDGAGVKVLFMHVPPAGDPYEVEDMTRAVKGIIEYFALHA